MTVEGYKNSCKRSWSLRTSVSKVKDYTLIFYYFLVGLMKVKKINIFLPTYKLMF